ncbi:hypothetical protein BJ875DRAFT_99756 [Amylocarpus encephaloides]|uniref:Uncharacterized protein n=1 Tax=Amylocarpus encephaloides TaxID=45428 RepID=A0A9P8C2Y1_9HELO|nr:hypothetical protein BJ875DRAFT_99756 [Amylocarpus encephaloides]
MSSFTPAFPHQHTKRPLSQAAQGWQSKWHPLLSPNGQNLIKSQFGVGDWLIVGCCLQAFIVLVSPCRLIWSLTPTFGLAIWKMFRTLLVIAGWVENPHMKDVVHGKTTTIFPNPDGSFTRETGQSIVGKGVVVVMLSSKCNHPLGMMYPPYKEILAHGRAMFQDLEKNADEYGLLGYSNYNGTDTTTKSVSMSVLYFTNMESLQRYAHVSKQHREGWEWWNQNGDRADEVSIGHEVYDVPEGKWETIYGNAKPYGFAATTHAIKTHGVERKYVCPIVDNKRMTAPQRMGTVKY